LIDGLSETPLASEVSRTELLQGMRDSEHEVTEFLMARLIWIPVGEIVSRRAGELGREWRRSHSGISVEDLIIAASAEMYAATLFTHNVRHFPMFPGLAPAY
jgi:predicted nucleic acid-binding protein